MKNPPKPWLYTKAREVNHGRSVVMDITAIEAIFQHYRTYGLPLLNEPKGKRK